MSGESGEEEKVGLPVCPQCGKAFKSRSYGQRFCSGSCGNVFRFRDPEQRAKISRSHSSKAHQLGYRKQAESLRRRYASGEIRAWNDGLAAAQDERVRLNAEKSHASLKKRYEADQEYRNFQRSRCKEMAKLAGAANRERLKGRSLEELYGLDKAQSIRERKSASSRYVKYGVTHCRKCGVILTQENACHTHGRRRSICRSCCTEMESICRNRRMLVRFERISKVLGLRCARCGFSDPRALQVDHKHGNGSSERRRFGSNVALYRYMAQLSEKELAENYQLLCANCNWIKRYENGEGVYGRKYHGALFVVLTTLQDQASSKS